MKKLYSILLTGSFYLLMAKSALAQIDIRPQTGSGFEGLANFQLNGSFLSAFITLLFIIAIVIALIYLIWGGIKWIMSGGDKQALMTAREHVIAAIVGLIVVFVSYFIVNFILQSFGITNSATIDNFLFNTPNFGN